MVDDAQDIRSSHKRLRSNYKRLFDEVAETLFRYDPLGLAAAGAPGDEYSLETGTIVPRLREANCAQDGLRIVYEEFVRWFGGKTAGPASRYEQVAAEVWSAWERHFG